MNQRLISRDLRISRSVAYTESKGLVFYRRTPAGSMRQRYHNKHRFGNNIDNMISFGSSVKSISISYFLSGSSLSWKQWRNSETCLLVHLRTQHFLWPPEALLFFLHWIWLRDLGESGTLPTTSLYIKCLNLGAAYGPLWRSLASRVVYLRSRVVT